MSYNVLLVLLVFMWIRWDWLGMWCWVLWSCMCWIYIWLLKRCCIEIWKLWRCLLVGVGRECCWDCWIEYVWWWGFVSWGVGYNDFCVSECLLKSGKMLLVNWRMICWVVRCFECFFLKCMILSVWVGGWWWDWCFLKIWLICVSF